MPTTVNAVLRNIDAVDCAATNISCKNLTVDGEPISPAIQNMGGSTMGNTVFTGMLTSDSVKTYRVETGVLLATYGEIATDLEVRGTAICNAIDTPTLNATTTITTPKITTDFIEASGGTLVVSSITSDDATIDGDFTVNGTGTISAVACSGLTVDGDAQVTGNLTCDTDLTVTGTTGLSGSLDVVGFTTFSNNVQQLSGTTSLLGLTATSITNQGVLTQGGAATFATNITQSAGTSSLRTVTATSVSNSGTLTQTGAATFATNITQSAGTAAFKTVTADSLTLAGTSLSTFIPSGSSYTLSATTTSLTLYSNFMRITLQGVSSASAYGLVLSIRNATGSTSGTTYGNQGATELAWSTRQVGLVNQSQVAAGSKTWGYVDIIRMSSTLYSVNGEMSFKGSNNYTSTIVGTITSPNFDGKIDIVLGATPAAGSTVISVGW